jgi:hypothetical protein
MSCKMIVSGVLVLGVIVLFFGYVKWQQHLTGPPKTLAEAQERITDAGFYMAGVYPYGMVISKEPITDEEANYYHLSCRKERFMGKAGIVARSRFEANLDAPHLSIFAWGNDLILFGDPGFIEEIVKVTN